MNKREVLYLKKILLADEKKTSFKRAINHGLLNRWTSHWLFRGAKNYDWGAGAWDPNYTPGVDFLTMIFFNLKNSG